MDRDTLLDHASTAEANWLDVYQRRKLTYESGGQAEPLGPVCRRYEIPKIEYHAGRIDPALLFELLRIDPGFEIIYDRFTALDMGPGHHLYRRVSGDGGGSHDLLVWEVSLQWNMRKMWPLGGPRRPGFWFLPVLKANLRDPNETPQEIRQGLRDRSRANRAEKVKTAYDLEMGAYEEIRPYLPTEVGGNGRIIQRTGRDKVPMGPMPKQYSLPQRRAPEPEIIVP